MTIGTLRALLDQASGYAEALFRPDDELMPHFIAEAADGALTVAALAMDGRDLDLHRGLLALRFAREGRRRWVFFAEGWQVEYAAGTSRCDPQDHPERMEVVLFDAVANRRVRASRQILRRDERTARLMPLVITRLRAVDVPDAPVEGRPMSAATADPAAWTLAARPVADGVQVEFAMPDRGLTAGIAMTRDEARAFARAVLAAAGDATERTYPRPPIEEA